MPYSIEELKNKPSYQNIIEADKNDLKKYFEDEELRAQQSGSTMEAVKTLRDEEGFILSYESPFEEGKTMPSPIQKVRLPMVYPNAVTEQLRSKLSKEREFSEFIPRKFWPPEPPAEEDDNEPFTEKEAEENVKKQEKEIDDTKAKDKAIKKVAESTGQTTEQVKEQTSNRKSPGRQDEGDRNDNRNWDRNYD